jgi:hypothetical protein
MCKLEPSAVGIATGYLPDTRGIGVRVREEAKFFCFPCRPDLFWDSPSLLLIKYQGIPPGVNKLTTDH